MIRSILTFVRFAILAFRYIISLAVLSVTLVTRTRIGQNSFGAWSNKPYGTGSSEYKTEWYGRLWTVALLYLWVRAFFLVYALKDAPPDFFLNMEAYKLVGHLLFSYNFFGEDVFSFSYDYTVPYLYSYYIVLLGLAHIVSFEQLRSRKERVSVLSLGKSLIFGWMKKYTAINDIIIWCWAEPLLMAAIGYLLFVYGYTAYAVFFWAASFGMAVQGQGRRLILVRMITDLGEGEAAGAFMAEYLKDTPKKEEDGKSKPNKQGDGAIFIEGQIDKASMLDFLKKNTNSHEKPKDQPPIDGGAQFNW